MVKKPLNLKIFQIRFYLSICTALHPHGPLTTLSDFQNIITYKQYQNTRMNKTSWHSGGRLRPERYIVVVSPDPLVRMTLSHHVKDSRLKCAAFAGDACACFKK